LFKNLGWETHDWFGRLSEGRGAVVRSTHSREICGKTGICAPVFLSEVTFKDSGGHLRRFETELMVQYDPGTEVLVEYYRGRPLHARIRLTADMQGAAWQVLSGVCGLGWPLAIGGLIVACQSLASLIRRGRTGVWPSIAGIVLHVIMLMVALLAELSLAAYLYWM
jgi:hypothetical protein